MTVIRPNAKLAAVLSLKGGESHMKKFIAMLLMIAIPVVVLAQQPEQKKEQKEQAGQMEKKAEKKSTKKAKRAAKRTAKKAKAKAKAKKETKQVATPESN